MTVDDSDERPGDPLHPGKHTIVNGGNHPLKEGEVVQVWFEMWAEDHGTETVTGDLQVIGDDGDGDIFAVPAHQSREDIDLVWRLGSNLSNISKGHVIERPHYDHETGAFEIQREVQSRGSRSWTLLEARSHGVKEYFDDHSL